MKNMKLIFIACLVLLGAGCANKSYVQINTAFENHNWKKIVILPFSGENAFSEMASETFTLHLLAQNNFKLIQPSDTTVTIKRLGIVQTNNTITTIQAQKVARNLNADAIIVGNITTYNNGMTLNAFATAKLIDVKSGEIIAASHQPSGLLMAYSEQQCAIAAVENVAQDMLKILQALSLKRTHKKKKIDLNEGVY